MLKHFKNNQINYQKWDKCIDDSSQGIVYALSWYLDIIKPNWEAIIWEQNNHYLAVMPLPVNKKIGIKHIYQPLYAQQFGIFSVIPLSPQLINFFLKILNAKFKYVAKYTFNTQNTSLLNQIEFDSFETKLFTTHHLDLSKPYHQIHKNYHDNHKQSLKKAKKHAISIIESENISPLIEIFKNNTAQKIRGGVAMKTYQTLEILNQKTIDKNMSRLFYSEDYSAACWFVFYKNKIHYLFNAAKSEFRYQNARTLIIDKIIRDYAQSNYILDFESPEVTSIANFYASFGAKSVHYHFISYNHLPILLRKSQEFKKYFLEKIKTTK